MRYIVKIFLCAAFIFSFTFVNGKAKTGTLPQTAKLVPPETILLVDIIDFSQLRKQFEQTSFYKLYKEPAMASVVGNIKTKLKEQIQKADNDLLKILVDTDVLPQGRVSIAFVLGSQIKDANETPILFISQWGENITKIKEAVDKIVTKTVEDDAHRKTEDYRNVAITTIIQKSSKTINYCFIDDCLIGCTNLDILKHVIAHLQGASSPTLFDESDYAATMKIVGPHHDVDFYVNIKQIISSILADDTTDQAKTIVANLGLDNASALGGAFGIARDPGGSSSCKVFLKINGPKKGLFKMLDVESAAIKTPQFIPDSTYSLISINLDIKKAYDELYNILLSFSPQYAALTHVPLLPPGPQGEPGLQLKTDIIAYLGSQIIIAQSINKPISNSSDPQMLLAVAINNRSNLEKSLSLLYDKRIAPDKPDARRELLGHTIYSADLRSFVPALRPGRKTPMLAPRQTGHRQHSYHENAAQTLQTPAAPDEPRAPNLAFTVTNTYLIFADEPAVERIIRTISGAEAASITASKWFNTAKLTIPSVVGMAGFQDNSTSGEIFWQMLKERPQNIKTSNKDSDIHLGISMSSKSPLPFVEFSRSDDFFDSGLLPEFELVRKYFGLSAYYGVSRTDGFFWEFKYLNTSGGN